MHICNESAALLPWRNHVAYYIELIIRTFLQLRLQLSTEQLSTHNSPQDEFETTAETLIELRIVFRYIYCVSRY